MVYQITRPDGSNRKFGCGITLEVGQSTFVDHPTAAKKFVEIGWEVKEVKKADGEVIHAASNEILSKLIDAKELHEMKKPKGRWLVEKPQESLAIYRYGYDVRHPVEVSDHDIVEKFRKDGFKVTSLDSQPQPELQPEAEPVGQENVHQEGSDVHPRGGPLTTHDMPRRKER